MKYEIAGAIRKHNGKNQVGYQIVRDNQVCNDEFYTDEKQAIARRDLLEGLFGGQNDKPS